MDSLLFSADDDDCFNSDRSLRPHRPDSELGNDAEQLYFVAHRWWNEARESLFVDSSDVKGVPYVAESSCARLGPMGTGADGSNSEIVLNMRRQDNSGKIDFAEEGDYALVAEWMFLRALKW